MQAPPVALAQPEVLARPVPPAGSDGNNVVFLWLLSKLPFRLVSNACLIVLWSCVCIPPKPTTAVFSKELFAWIVHLQYSQRHPWQFAAFMQPRASGYCCFVVASFVVVVAVVATLAADHSLPTTMTQSLHCKPVKKYSCFQMLAYHGT